MRYVDPLRYKTEVIVLWKNRGTNYLVLNLLLTPIELTKNILRADNIPNFYGIAAITTVADGFGRTTGISCHTISGLRSVRSSCCVINWLSNYLREYDEVKVRKVRYLMDTIFS